MLAAVKKPREIVVLDTETGGLDPLTHSILSVGLVNGDGSQTLEFYVKEPEIVTNPRSMKVNRIDLNVVEAEGVSPVEACERLDAFIEERGGPGAVMLVGHNIAFDIAFLRRLYHLAGRFIPDVFAHRTIDTHTLMWALVSRGKLPAHIRGSDTAFAHFDVSPPPELRHTALGDAVATRELVIKLLELVG
jgi:DNA polymerase-3 subunit epsilon